MVDLSLPALLAGYVVAALVPAVAIYVLLANLVEERLEEVEERLTTQAGRGQEANGQGSPGLHLVPEWDAWAPGKIPPAPQASEDAPAEAPLDAWSEQG